jgi:Spy/CpxP family protein refolding chaperone
MRKPFLVFAGLAVTGVALAAAPEGPKPAGPRGDRPRLERKNMKEALGLTDAQAAELKKLRTDGEKRRIKTDADMKIARLELRELLLAPSVDEKAVRAKARQMADLQAAAANDRVESMLALRKVVSAEQAEKLMKHRHARPAGGPGARGFGRHEGPGGKRGPGHGAPRGPRVGESDNAEDDEESSAL